MTKILFIKDAIKIEIAVLISSFVSAAISFAGSLTPQRFLHWFATGIFGGVVGMDGDGTIDPSGGTNAAADGRGLIDMQTLIDNVGQFFNELNLCLI